ncbi:hypothetical protein D9619_008408 [Psilocybe cf. subviscida]|uniref:Uncharacterized protein n=1 Tax=Psilocybe cf. subviscida TaxID=2480587 RepID=A0A8H5BAE3_9AGAR|nr:hypothetical protein D9619_008408 [Psilocybe cf. subviscida]
MRRPLGCEVTDAVRLARVHLAWMDQAGRRALLYLQLHFTRLSGPFTWFRYVGPHRVDFDAFRPLPTYTGAQFTFSWIYSVADAHVDPPSNNLSLRTPPHTVARPLLGPSPSNT